MRINIDQIAKQRGVKISYFESTTSTNTLALEGEYRHADLLLANHQSGGRGQRGHSWESVRGENLTFSLVIEPHWLMASGQFVLSKMVSLALIDTLETYGIEGRIKWTNDIYIEGRKVAGILIENEIVGDRVVRSVLGVGLNVNQRSFSSDLPNPTSMALEMGRQRGESKGDKWDGNLKKTGGCSDETIAHSDCGDAEFSGEVDRMEVLDRFLSAFWRRYSAVSDQRPEALDDDYHERLYLLNTPHRYRLPSGDTFIGIIRSVESSGELVVESEDGSMQGYLFGEIAF